MIKRLTWFVGGAVAGATGAGMAKRKVKAKAAELAPVHVARNAANRVRDAIDEGRTAMRHKEAELRARRDGRAAPLAAELDGVESVLVDGRPVEPGRVIVLRQVDGDTRQPRRRRA